jgi:hypothetical protein
MEKYIKAICADQADKIREQIKGGTLYGEPIDMNNPDAVLFAAVLMTEQRMLSARSRYLATMSRIGAFHEGENARL